tara:strand:- start:1881 stop:2099 length:219 start_codon:yes stop_codon:yes gene_type:complete
MDGADLEQHGRFDSVQFTCPRNERGFIDKMIYRSKAEQLVKDFVIKHDLDAQFVQETEGLMYVRIVVEEDKA